MIEDLKRLLRHICEIAYYVRGLLLSMLLGLAICSVVFVLCEDISIGESIYLTLITALTVGYGDVVPTTVLGRITSIVVGLIGVIFIGIMVAAVTRALSRSHEEKTIEQRRTSPR